MTEQTFFAKLKEETTSIEKIAAEWKALSETKFNRHQPLTHEDAAKIREFDSKVRSLYVQLAAVNGEIKSKSSTIDSLEQQLVTLDKDIERYVLRNNLKKHGYVPWRNPNPIEAKFVEEEVECEVLRHAPSPAPTVTLDKKSSITPNGKSLRKKPNKSAAPRTPQAADFGLNNRRMTLFPKSMLKRQMDNGDQQESNNRENQKSAFKEQFAARLQQKLASRNPFDNDNATFNLPKVNAAKYNIPSNAYRARMQNVDSPETPTANSSQDHSITVEFTPGLTTRRPGGKSRVKHHVDDESNGNSNSNEIHMAKNDGDNNPYATPPYIVADVTRSLKEMNVDFNKHISETPRQPIVSKQVINSIKMVKSLRKEQLGTPQMPSLTFDQNFHQRLLGKK